MSIISLYSNEPISHYIFVLYAEAPLMWAYYLSAESRTYLFLLGVFPKIEVSNILRGKFLLITCINSLLKSNLFLNVDP